ncbi:MAG: hypothetical protein ACK4FR_02065 [Tabrizicola sp.]
MIRTSVVVLAVLPGVASAQEDYMEVQRCVWRCLADSPGAESAEYHQCVAASCGEPAPESALPPAAAPPVAPASGFSAWTFGQTADGQGRYAGQYAAETGSLIYYTCDGSGTQNLLLSGEAEGPGGVLTLDADGQVLGLWFEPSPGGYTARLEPGSPVPDLLMRAARFELRNEAGWSLGRFAMGGAREAIGSARASCGL